MISNANLKLQYEGSVKNVFTSKSNPDSLWFSFTDQYSVFDWGKMPDSITNKGNALALIGTHIFQTMAKPQFWQKLPGSTALKKFDSQYLHQRFTHPVFKGDNGLEQKGLPSHFLGLYRRLDNSDNWQIMESPFKNANANDQLLMQVLAAHVGWPTAKTILHENVYFYPPPEPDSKRRLIPLEIVFRFGIVEGSSLKHKLQDNPDYATKLGLKNIPKTNEWFSQPVLEFFTKLEPKDRLLSWQEAANLANLSFQQFKKLVELSLDIALGLHAFFAQHNLELWDGKLEFIYESQSTINSNKDGQLLLADSVGPDELRLLYNGVHLSKEILRQYYRPSAWAKSLNTAQRLAIKSGQENWQLICQQELNQSPQPLTANMKQLANQLYGVLANELIGQAIFPAHLNLADFTSQVEQLLASHNKERINV